MAARQLGEIAKSMNCGTQMCRHETELINATEKTGKHVRISACDEELRAASRNYSAR
jgi:hypothetical protein